MSKEIYSKLDGNSPMEIFNKFLFDLSKEFNSIFSKYESIKLPEITVTDNIIFGDNQIIIYNLIKINIDVNSSKLRINFCRDIVYLDFYYLDILKNSFNQIELLMNKYNLLYSSISKNFNSSVSLNTVENISNLIIKRCPSVFNNYFILPSDHIVKKLFGVSEYFEKYSYMIKFFKDEENPKQIIFKLYKGELEETNQLTVVKNRFSFVEEIYSSRFSYDKTNSFIKDLFLYSSLDFELKQKSND